MSFKNLMQSLLGLFVPRNSMGATEKLVYGLTFGQTQETAWDRNGEKIVISRANDDSQTSFTATQDGILCIYCRDRPDSYAFGVTVAENFLFLIRGGTSNASCYCRVVKGRNYGVWIDTNITDAEIRFYPSSY